MSEFSRSEMSHWVAAIAASINNVARAITKLATAVEADKTKPTPVAITVRVEQQEGGS